jgi:L-ascorbate peroxidase
MEKIIEDNQCYPLMLRLAWTDAASYDQTIKEWPACGGANGTIRFERNLDLPSNAGLGKGIQYLNELKFKYPLISWADMIQMAGALAVKLAGGPDIKLRYGRQDCNDSHFEVKVSIIL